MDIFDLKNVIRILVFPGTGVDHTLRRSFAENVNSLGYLDEETDSLEY